MYFYSSASPDSPQLNNEWGNFNEIINYIIDGGAEYDILKIEPYNDYRVKIYYDDTLLSSPWCLYQTIVVTGSTKNYNGDFFIESINEYEKYIICYRSSINILLAETETVTHGVIAARIKPCGATRVNGGINDNRTIIRFDDSVEFRIDDRNFANLLAPPVTFNNNWIKCARVCMAESFDGLDFTMDRQYPYTPSRPTENFNPSGLYIGTSFIPYNDNSNDTSYITATTTKGQCSFKIYANSKCMYIQIFIGTNITNYYSRFSIIGNFDSIDKSKPNGILQLNRNIYQYNSTNQIMRSSNTAERLDFTYDINRTNKILAIYNDTTDNAADAILYGGFGYGSTAPSGNGGLRLPNIADSTIYFSDVQVIANNSYMGKLYDVKWVNTDYRPDVYTTILIDDELYICNLSYDSSTFIKLDRP